MFFTLYGHKVAPTTSAVFSQDEAGGAYFSTSGADAQVMVWKANFNLKENDVEQLDATVQKPVRQALAPTSRDNFSSSTIKANVDSRQKEDEEAVDVGEAFILPAAAGGSKKVC